MISKLSLVVWSLTVDVIIKKKNQIVIRNCKKNRIKKLHKLNASTFVTILLMPFHPVFIKSSMPPSTSEPALPFSPRFNINCSLSLCLLSCLIIKETRKKKIWRASFFFFAITLQLPIIIFCFLLYNNIVDFHFLV